MAVRRPPILGSTTKITSAFTNRSHTGLRLTLIDQTFVIALYEDLVVDLTKHIGEYCEITVSADWIATGAQKYVQITGKHLLSTAVRLAAGPGEPGLIVYPGTRCIVSLEDPNYLSNLIREIGYEAWRVNDDEAYYGCVKALHNLEKCYDSRAAN